MDSDTPTVVPSPVFRSWRRLCRARSRLSPGGPSLALRRSTSACTVTGPCFQIVSERCSKPGSSQSDAAVSRISHLSWAIASFGAASLVEDDVAQPPPNAAFGSMAASTRRTACMPCAAGKSGPVSRATVRSSQRSASAWLGRTADAPKKRETITEKVSAPASRAGSSIRMWMPYSTSRSQVTDRFRRVSRCAWGMPNCSAMRSTSAPGVTPLDSRKTVPSWPNCAWSQGSLSSRASSRLCETMTGPRPSALRHSASSSALRACCTASGPA